MSQNVLAEMEFGMTQILLPLKHVMTAILSIMMDAQPLVPLKEDGIADNLQEDSVLASRLFAGITT